MRSVVLAGTVILAAAGTAHATYPGRDGRIAFFVATGCPRYDEPSAACAALRFSALRTISPTGRGIVDVVRCPGATCIPGFGPGLGYSPDGRRLAVGVGPDPASGAPPQVAILRADGSVVRRVPLPVPANDGDRRWLPGWPTTVSARSPIGDVATARPHGISVVERRTGARRLILKNSGHYLYEAPDWSPNGRRLAVIRRDLQTSLDAIVTVAARGGHRHVVVRRIGEIAALRRVVWSPSGTRIAFTTGGDENEGGLYTVRTDGARLRRIFDVASLVGDLGEFTASMGSDLAWQPLGVSR
jgi:WD40-like Beta Propeller Repeat